MKYVKTFESFKIFDLKETQENFAILHDGTHEGDSAYHYSYHVPYEEGDTLETIKIKTAQSLATNEEDLKYYLDSFGDALGAWILDKRGIQALEKAVEDAEEHGSGDDLGLPDDRLDYYRNEKGKKFANDNKIGEIK